MENNRQIRFLIPPFFLISWLLLGAYLSGKDLLKILPKISSFEKLIALTATAGIIVISIGFLIGIVSVAFLRLISLSVRPELRGKYDAPYTVDDSKRVWSKISMKGDIQPNSQNIMYAISTFQNTAIEERVQYWLGRRWNAFLVSAHSTFALLLAHVFAPMIDIRTTCNWLIFTMIIIGLLALNGWIAFNETRDMVIFQTYRDIPKQEPKAHKPKKKDGSNIVG